MAPMTSQSGIACRKRAVLLATTRPTRFSAILSLALISFFGTGASGSTMLDPLPENSTTRFGQALVTLGDINGDGVPDLAVAAPFQDGDFVSTQTSYGKPQNVGKIFFLDGANLSILNELNDPEFELIQ